ncbi:preprotein translocase subunit SecA [Caproiciproducens sp. LBM24188]|nr:preprotein translocase subunit SecA [Oscillospiraceae bacterium]HHV31010.1 preprotein translocase subunit SecA [Clostridiales bacterium]
MAKNILSAFFGNYSKRELKRIQPICDAVLALEDQYKSMSDEELKAQTPALKERLADGATLDDILPEAFAVCREASARVLGMRHFPVQVIGGIVLHQGRIAEMKTGEGKTLVATLPAYLNALSGNGVHVVTVNDYLARRDSEWMGKIFRFLGLNVGLIVHDLENEDRKKAYAADITYGTNNEFGFDYLRDNMVIYKEDKVQRGHNYAIVDEVDSILIDEARTPLIISGQGDKSTELYTIADHFAKSLRMVRVAELNEKEDNDELYKDADYIVDEKAKTATLTPSGVKKAEEYFHLENLMDADNLTIQHHINQAIKANGVMRNDIDYVVKDGEVIIVDEFTGRLMYGRRYNEGLHQAIEAKEGVKVAHESKTLATITFQNYFRLYSKLSGMTGTAKTEEAEFNEIYKLDIIEIPTNKPMIRKDLPDVVYKTEKAKFNAVIDDILEHHEKGQPVLVGTISIEKSEELSALLRRRGIKHEVLNAKYHEKEAEIIAQAGRKGAVTIATNMAGRGTDIMLGGNSEYMAKTEMRRMQFSEELISEATAYSETTDEEILNARKVFAELDQKYREQIKEEAEEVKAAGGLYIIGTERHESRRIDNQLRGRAGRQGDPGMSRFYISLEDDLMRLFGGDRINALMERLNVDENTPIENKMLTNTIESAQRKIEGRNFGIRKNVLQYDDVMNRQREIIYSQRDQVLNGENIKEQILKMIEQAVDAQVKQYLPENTLHDDWNMNGLRDHYMGWLITQDDLVYSADELERLEPEFVKNELVEKATALYEAREKMFGEEIMRELERVVLLKNVDTEWMDHIDAMEELKRGINLRAYGQHDPVVEYRLEGFDMFDQMIATIRENTARMMLTVQIRTQEEPKREQVATPTATSADGTDTPRTVHKGKKPGRNDPCPCGSGKKYKKCCGRDD